VVSTHLKNICPIGSFPQVGMNIKNISKHHLAKNEDLVPKHSMELVYLTYIYIWLIFYGFHVGKYTSSVFGVYHPSNPKVIQGTEIFGIHRQLKRVDRRGGRHDLVEVEKKTKSST